MTGSSLKYLITADWHLDPRHPYRSEVIDFVSNFADTERIFILGDVLDRPYGQPLPWVVDVLTRLRDLGAVILLGNHDRADGGRSLLELLPPDQVVADYRVVGDFLCIANRRDPSDIPDLVAAHPQCSLVLLHQPAFGAALENGHLLDSGIRVAELCRQFPDRTFISGDIHTPQILEKRWIYVGAPHHTAYGGSYEPRVLHVDLSTRRIRSVRTLLWKKAVVREVVKPRPKTMYRVIGDAESVERIATEIASNGGVVDDTVVEVERQVGEAATIISKDSPVEVYQRFCDAHSIAQEYVDYGKQYI